MAEAWQRACKLVGGRPRTEAELRQALTEAGHGTDEVDSAVRRVAEAGHLDDYRLARDYVVARSARLRHSRERLLRDLERRGVDPAVAAAAWQDAEQAGDVDPGVALDGELRRHIARAGGHLDEKAWRRVYNALLRAGHERERVAAALEAHLPTEHD